MSGSRGSMKREFAKQRDFACKRDGGRVPLESGASLRWTDEGVRPYVIFCGPPQWERSFAPPDGRGRPSLRDSKRRRFNLLSNRQIQVLNLECTLCL